jgi:hypothetical protein
MCSSPESKWKFNRDGWKVKKEIECFFQVFTQDAGRGKNNNNFRALKRILEYSQICEKIDLFIE